MTRTAQACGAVGRTGLALALLASASCAPGQGAHGFNVPTLAPAAVSDPVLFLAPAAATPRRRANFLNVSASVDARLVANWVVDSDDNEGLPFSVIDKVGAKVFVFDASGTLRGATFALLGLAPGDETVPGIGSEKLSAITPSERTTPAGRFAAQMGVDAGQSVLWIDYAAAIAMHPVVFGSPGDHRFARLASPSARDKRITFGCVNVPANFYNNVVVRTFSGTTGIVYILPETKSLTEVFPDVENFGVSISPVAVQIR